MAVAAPTPHLSTNEHTGQIKQIIKLLLQYKESGSASGHVPDPKIDFRGYKRDAAIKEAQLQYYSSEKRELLFLKDLFESHEIPILTGTNREKSLPYGILIKLPDLIPVDAAKYQKIKEDVEKRIQSYKDQVTDLQKALAKILSIRFTASSLKYITKHLTITIEHAYLEEPNLQITVQNNSDSETSNETMKAIDKDLAESFKKARINHIRESEHYVIPYAEACSPKFERFLKEKLAEFKPDIEAKAEKKVAPSAAAPTVSATGKRTTRLWRRDSSENIDSQKTVESTAKRPRRPESASTIEPSPEPSASF